MEMILLDVGNESFSLNLTLCSNNTLDEDRFDCYELSETGFGVDTSVPVYGLTSVSNNSWPEKEVAQEVGSQLPFSFWSTVFIAVAIGICSIVTIVGNILVLGAFVVDRQIRQPSNYFICSLAVSDLCIGFFSMPIYAIYVLQGTWELGPIACDLWLATDHTVCLVSIYTVLLITIDRFCSIKIPTKYRNWRTRRKVVIMVALTWIIPALVFFISIMGWEHFIGFRDVAPGQCEVQFLKNPIFNISLIIGYFYITLIVMCVLYIKIYRIARDMARKSEEKAKKVHNLVAMNRNLQSSQTATGIYHGQGECQGKKGLSFIGGQVSTRDNGDKHPEGFNGVTSNEQQANDAGNSSDQDRSSSPVFDSDEEAPEIPQTKNLKQDLRGHRAPATTKQQQIRSERKSKEKEKEKSTRSGSAPSKCVVTILPAPVPPLIPRSPIVSQTPHLDLPPHPSERRKSAECIHSSDTSTVQSSSSDFCVRPNSLDLLPAKGDPMVKAMRSNNNKQEKSTESTITDHNVSSMSGFVNQPCEAQIRATKDHVGSEKCPDRSVVDCRADPSSPVSEQLANMMKRDIQCCPDESDKVKGQLSAQREGTKAEELDIIGTGSAEEALSPNSAGRGALVLKLSKKLGNGRRRKERRQKSKSENRARKALRTISFILGAFVICWTPYHINSLIEGIWKGWVNEHHHLFYFTYFLCYINSPVNPFCYAMANQHYKKAFFRILKGDFHRT
ncbi:muscarinic acetylcholine receptor gar-2-like [Brevipalpus obovatus]|uniref:muscarinic acetylcholine receptor gar-2-like n=1 Tax=Brevipalpus obovatus TaxID=246614 RepID=UPI003D9E47F0